MEAETRLTTSCMAFRVYSFHYWAPVGSRVEELGPEFLRVSRPKMVLNETA